MARFTQPGGSGEGTPLPQGLGTSSSPTFDKVYTTHNSEGTNVKIGDDAWIGDVDTMNHVAIIGVGDATQGGLIFGSNETEFISSDGTNLSLTANNDIILNPGSTYAYIGTPQLDGSNRIAKMSDIIGGGTDNHGDFYFDQSTLSVDSSGDMILEANEGDGSVASQIKVGKGDVPIDIAAYEVQENWFNTGDWSTAEWQSDGGSAGQIVLTGITNLEQYLNNFNGDFQKILINDSTLANYNGASYGGGNATIYVSQAPTETTTVNNLTFIQSLRSGLRIDLDNSDMNIDAPNMSININSGNDIDLNAEDDIRFYTNTDVASNYWRMTSEGLFELPGDGYISNPSQSSGDGYNNDTIHIVPDSDLNSDQYLIIDPTAPNHIHIRAGGTQDSSNADLIIGGELTNVRVSDGDRNVTISSKPLQQSMAHLNVNSNSDEYLITTDEVVATSGWTVDVNGTLYYIADIYYNSPNEGQTTIYAPGAPFTANGVYNVFAPQTVKQWEFDYNGTLYGPAQGGVAVNSITNDPDFDLGIYSDKAITLSGTTGEFLNDSSVESNQIATIGDLTEAVGVGGNGEVTRWSPNFTATGLAFTGTDTTYPTYNSHYVKNGRMVSFWIAIDLATVTNFGTGQYKTELPFAPLTGTMNHFQAWANVDPLVNPDIAGHVVLQADHLANTSVLDLHYLKQAGGANSPLMEAMLVQDEPATFTTSSKIYINGTYITAE